MNAIYRADVLGSLLRPSVLKDARAAFAAGRISVTELKQVEDRYVDASIAMQEAVGLDVVADGEMRRSWFSGLFTDQLEGIGQVPEMKARLTGEGAEAPKEYDVPMVTGKIRRRRPWATEEFAYARARSLKPVKVALPSPLMIFLHWSSEHARGAYNDPFELFADTTAVVRAEVEELAAIGCTYIQIDAPEVCLLLDPAFCKSSFDDHGISSKRALIEGMEMVNAVAAPIPGVTFGLHYCRGNFKGAWFGQGDYGPVARDLFGRASNYQTLLLEYDDARSGSFEALRAVPDDKVVVLGLVSSKTNTLEPADEILRRIDEAARHFPREQMTLSTQCGFASVLEGNPVSAETQEAKLRLVADVAHRAWK